MWFHKTALYLAVEKGYVEIVKFLLMNDNINVNIINIFIYIFLSNFQSNNSMKFLIKFVNYILTQIFKCSSVWNYYLYLSRIKNYIFLLYSKSNDFIEFKVNYFNIISIQIIQWWNYALNILMTFEIKYSNLILICSFQ